MYLCLHDFIHTAFTGVERECLVGCIQPGSLHAVKLSARCAGRGEKLFVGQLLAADFVVDEIPTGHLHEEYADGQYQIIRVCKLGK